MAQQYRYVFASDRGLRDERLPFEANDEDRARRGDLGYVAYPSYDRRTISSTRPSSTITYTSALYDDNRREQPAYRRSGARVMAARVPRSRSLNTEREPARDTWRSFEEWHTLDSRPRSVLGTVAKEDSSDAAARPRRRSSLDSFQIELRSAEIHRTKGSAESRGERQYDRQVNDSLRGIENRRDIIVPMGLVDQARGWETDSDDGVTEWETDEETGEKVKLRRKKGDRSNITVRLPEKGCLTVIDDAGRVRVQSSDQRAQRTRAFCRICDVNKDGFPDHTELRRHMYRAHP